MIINTERFTNLFKTLSIEYTDLTDKHVVITGGNVCIGFETALHLAKMNCKVTIASRNLENSKLAVDKIIKLTSNQNIDYFSLDLGSFNSIKAFSKEFTNKYSKLDFLINNSGCIFDQFALTENGLERSLQINHLGPLALTLELLTVLKSTENSRLIFLTSDLHLDVDLVLPSDLESSSTDYNGFKVYSKVKIMNLMTVKKLAQILESSNKTPLVCAVHPGIVKTELAHKDMLNTWTGYIGSRIFRGIQYFIARTPEQGAITSVFAITSSDVKAGEYYDSCKASYYNPQADDVKLVDKLWISSLNLIGAKNIN